MLQVPYAFCDPAKCNANGSLSPARAPTTPCLSLSSFCCMLLYAIRAMLLHAMCPPAQHRPPLPSCCCVSPAPSLQGARYGMDFGPHNVTEYGEWIGTLLTAMIAR